VPADLVVAGGHVQHVHVLVPVDVDGEDRRDVPGRAGHRLFRERLGGIVLEPHDPSVPVESGDDVRVAVQVKIER